jgi:hypothetical protein
MEVVDGANPVDILPPSVGSHKRTPLAVDIQQPEGTRCLIKSIMTFTYFVLDSDGVVGDDNDWSDRVEPESSVQKRDNGVSRYSYNRDFMIMN